MGGVFWVLNSPLKWIIQTLSFPVNMLTLGLFSLVINVAIFYLFEWVMNRYFAPDVKVQLGNILQTLVLSLIMAVGSGILKKIV
jgi:putative membrane protein